MTPKQPDVCAPVAPSKATKLYLPRYATLSSSSSAKRRANRKRTRVVRLSDPQGTDSTRRSRSAASDVTTSTLRIQSYVDHRVRASLERIGRLQSSAADRALKESLGLIE